MTQVRKIVSALGVADAVSVWTPYPHQVPPAWDWDTWMLLAGRGSGKTEAMARYVEEHLREYGPLARVGVGAPTSADARDICAEGLTGLITLFPPPTFRWNRSLLEAFHINGGYVKFMGTENPDRWNGPQWSLLWFDELALCNPHSWEQAEFGLRIGERPRAVVSTTPKNRKFIKDMMNDPRLALTTATTYDNPKLAARVLARLEQRYGGTRLGRQELMGEFVEDVEGALWKRDWIERFRVPDVPREPVEEGQEGPGRPLLARVVVAIDPAGTATKKSDETGLCAAARDYRDPPHFYILHAQGYRLSPSGWAQRALGLFDTFSADRLIAETNNGGDMVEHTIRVEDPNASVKTIHASRGKTVRAEPVAALYEQGRVHHVGMHPEAEDQMCAFPVENENDDIVDGIVYAVTELASGGQVNVRFL